MRLEGVVVSRTEGSLGRWMAAGLVVLALSGCGGVFDPGGFRGQLDAATGGTSTTDLALAALNKGEYGRAEQLATSAVRFNPQDPYAAYVLAEVYLNTGRPELARKQYEALVSLDAQQTVVQGSGDAAKRVTLVNIARARLAQLNPPAPTQMASPADRPLVAIDEQGAGAEGAMIRRIQNIAAPSRRGSHYARRVRPKARRQSRRDSSAIWRPRRRATSNCPRRRQAKWSTA